MASRLHGFTASRLHGFTAPLISRFGAIAVIERHASYTKQVDVRSEKGHVVS
jgi:hypothetical protein